MGRRERAALRHSLLATRPRWRLAIASMLLGTGAVVAAGALLGVSGYLISRAAQRPEILTLGVAIVGVRFFGISRAILRYAERLVSHDLAFRTLTDLRVRFFQRLVPLVPGGLPGVASSDLLSRFVADRLQDLYLRGIAPPAIALLAGGAGAIAAYLILPAAALAIVAVLVLGGIVAPLLTRMAARRSGSREAAARADLTQNLTQIASGGAEIAVAGRAGDWESAAAASGRRLAQLMRRGAIVEGAAVGLAEAIAAGAAVLMLVLAAPAVADGDLPGVLLAALVLLALASVEAIAPLGSAAASIDAVATAAARLEEVTERPPPILEPTAPRPVPSAGNLVVSAVSFAYEPGRPILDDVSLEVTRGRAIAIAGPSGTGKSTLADLLVRFCDPVEGSIALGGVDLRDLDGDALRTSVRLGPQDAALFATSIRANLALANPDGGDASMVEVLDSVGLGQWLASLPDGLDSQVGESGALVSGGERRRLATARLLLSEAPFLIFDEPTAQLDEGSGAQVLGAIVRQAHEHGRAVVVITHEPTGLAGFDEVLELRSGTLRPGVGSLVGVGRD